jgi:hypothetical protein
MTTTFLFYNSWWRNLALTLISAPFALAPILLGYSQFIHDKWMLLGSIMFGFGTILFGYRFLDRRIKVKIDSAGVNDYRTSYGLIPWQEIASYRLWSVKGNDYITLNPKSPQVWLRRANAFVRSVSGFIGVRKFSITVSLQNMAVNEVSLIDFMNEMIKISSSDGRQGASADVKTATRFQRG